MNTKLVALCAMALLLSGCQTSTPIEPQLIVAEGTYVHTPSGVTFPSEGDQFKRLDINRYDAEGQNIGVGYDVISVGGKGKLAGVGRVIATAYVYPSTSLISIGSPASVVADARENLCNNEFAQTVNSIIDRHPGAKALQQGGSQSTLEGPRIKGKRVTFAFEMPPWGKVKSELHLFCYVGEKWSIKYRFTYADQFDAAKAISEFMARVPQMEPSRN